MCVKIAKVKNIKESEYKYQIIECYWSLWIKIKSIRVKNLNNMLKKKCNICFENGRTQSNMCLKSVREIIFLNRYQRFYSCFLYVLIQMVWCSSGLARYTSVLLNTQRCILSFNIIYANAATQEVANRHIAWDKKKPPSFNFWTYKLLISQC